MIFDDLHLLVEFTDFCNEKCGYCKQADFKTIHGEMPKRFLQFDQLIRLVEGLKNNKLKVTALHPIWIGESLLHPQIAEMLSYLFIQNKQYNLFRGFVLNTNATLMSPQISDILMDHACYVQEHAGEYHYFRVHFSLDTIREETYSKIRQVPGKLLDQAMRNIDYILQQRRRLNLVVPNFTFAFIVLNENFGEAEEFLEFWSRKLGDSGVLFEVTSHWPTAVDKDSIYFRRCEGGFPPNVAELYEQVTTRLGLSKDLTTPSVQNPNAPRPPCAALWRTPTIAASGVVVPCCIDADVTLPVGTLSHNTLDEIWGGPTITDLRLAHIRGAFEKYPTCHQCTASEREDVPPEDVIRYLEAIGKSEEIEPYLQRMRVIKTQESNVNHGT